MSLDRAQSLQLILDADKAGHPALIIELARRYLAAWPDDRHALRAYAEALTSIARYPEARVAYERGLGLAETDAQRGNLYSALGHLCRAHGEVHEAEDWYARAAAARPMDAGPRIYLGALLAKAGRLEEASKVHEEATRLSEGPIDEAWLNLGFVRRAREDYVGALECFRRALAIDPLDTDAQAALLDIEQVLFEFPQEPHEPDEG
jgi:tetratricopeptide (TPR) repeat protein